MALAHIMAPMINRNNVFMRDVMFIPLKIDILDQDFTKISNINEKGC